MAVRQTGAGNAVKLIVIDVPEFLEDSAVTSDLAVPLPVLLFCIELGYLIR